jgi:hypothetical protein
MALLVGIELDGILGALFAVPVTGMLYVITMAIYYHFTGRPAPAVRKTATPVLWGSLGNTEIVRTLRARLPDSLQTDAAVSQGARATTMFPRRLAEVEELRDALVRDKMQQRHMISESAHPEPTIGLTDVAVPDRNNAPQEAGDLADRPVHKEPEHLADEPAGREPAGVR